MSSIPVIFGGYVNGYSIARTFYETYGLQSVICDYKQQFSKYSCFSRYITISDPKEEQKFLDCVAGLGKMLTAEGKTPLIIPTSDEYLLALSKYREILAPYFVYSFSPMPVIERLTIKEKLYTLCDEIGIVYPKTDVIASGQRIRNDLTCPILIKPSSVVEYVSMFPHGRRNHVFSTHDEANQYIAGRFDKGYRGTFIAQEYIPGGIENLYTITTFSDHNSALKGLSTGHKLTQFPKDAGTITAGLIRYEPRLIEPAKKILETAGYYGITNIEFKYDCRDDQFKLIEVNPRPGMWNYSAYKSGVNLFKMMVDDIIDKKEVCFQEGKEPVVWSVISPGELLLEIKDTPNSAIVKQYINSGHFINPRRNAQESMLFRCSVAYDKAMTDFRQKVRSIRESF